MKIIIPCKVMAMVHKRQVLVDILKHIARTKSGDLQTRALDASRPYFDAALLGHFKRLRSKGMEPLARLQNHRDICGYLMGSSDVDAALHANCEYGTVACQVRRIHKSRKTGEAVLNFAFESLPAEAAAGSIGIAL